MRRYRRRALAAAGLVALAALSLPKAEAHLVPSGPDYQATEKDFAVEHFSANSINVTNRFLPIPPGTTFTLAETVGASAHEVVFTITEVTKDINGDRTQDLYDRNFNKDELI